MPCEHFEKPGSACWGSASARRWHCWHGLFTKQAGPILVTLSLPLLGKQAPSVPLRCSSFGRSGPRSGACWWEPGFVIGAPWPSVLFPVLLPLWPAVGLRVPEGCACVCVLCVDATSRLCIYPPCLFDHCFPFFCLRVVRAPGIMMLRWLVEPGPTVCECALVFLAAPLREGTGENTPPGHCCQLGARACAWGFFLREGVRRFLVDPLGESVK